MMLAYSFHVKCLSRVLKKAACAVESQCTTLASLNYRVTRLMTVFQIVMIRIKCGTMKADISVVLSIVAALIHKEKYLS